MMINNLEELYAFNYYGTRLDISALLVYIRNKNEKEGKQYLVKKGLNEQDADTLIKEVQRLLAEDSSFAHPENGTPTKDFFGEVLFKIDGNRGRRIRVYEDFVVIDVTATVGSVLTGNAFDGRKIIFYADCIGIQYKEPGSTIGFLQLETASPTMNNKSNNFFNENTFTFGTETVAIARKAYRYIFERVREIKTGVTNTESLT